MKPNHKCDPARMALLYIRQQFICTTFKFDAYNKNSSRINRSTLEVSSYIFCNALESLLLQFPKISLTEYYVWANPSNTEKKSSRYGDKVH